MIEIEGTGRDLAKVAGGTISRKSRRMTVGQLELALLARFPREDAEDWDRTGLLVGDPAANVEGVAVALDATGAAIDAAVLAGANVLLTHHPAFLEAPAPITPSHEVSGAAGANVFKAMKSGVALMNFHTALDVSREATRVLPGLLSLDFDRLLEPLECDAGKGYGQVCEVRPGERPLKLSHLAARCTSVFGRPPRVWGDFDLELRTVCIANGSAGNVVDACARSGIDCLVCGEVRYHAALDASQAGLCIVEVGHDSSELPLTAVLAKACVDAGVEPADVSVIDQVSNWKTPETTRI